ncbi:EcsC family protein [Salmonella enterica]|uniref:EcsC family protein n=1 Tax=Salmonella enterica subsp. houtenae serovar 18:z36,z38:- TaxID=2577510 RepID=A0A729K8P4_SALHO|nr:EcsC family protein [Salmonella enterica]ECC1641631.1 EcsC family protein [Salmonella enterica subsp. houtenae]MBA2162983.1 EcsC family protein [Salmonella enterica subsp. houtenae serovar 18:z36,z38:-]EBD0801591.1 EcsC family protein [Salmonella enterica]EEP9800656.1 EcsC family protein [Salmonella enterica subsp. houtenae]
MKNPLTTETIQQALDWAYDKAVNSDIPGLDNARDMAQNYMKQEGELVDKVNSLIRWQNTKAGAAGFAAGLGGLLAMPVTLPADITSVLYIQIRMIAAIAHMGGHSLSDDRVKSLVFVCLCGNSANEALKQAGVQAGQKLALVAIKKVPGEMIKAVNKAVGFKLLTKFGAKGVINIGKMVPILGGVIGGAFDGVACNIIGNVARETFIESIAADKS